jgi:cell division initiation protein
MAISSRDIEEIGFKVVPFRGYKVAEVDDFLDRVSTELERLQGENNALQARIAECEERDKRVSELEQTLRDTLITAQRAAEDVLRASREKAAAMIKDSELEGRRIVEDAELRATQAAQRLEGISRDVAGVKALIRRVLGEQLRLLEESYPDTSGDPQDRQQAAKPAAPAVEKPTLPDFDQTQEFSVREVREQAQEDAGIPRFRNLSERLPQTGQDGDVQA